MHPSFLAGRSFRSEQKSARGVKKITIRIFGAPVTRTSSLELQIFTRKRSVQNKFSELQENMFFSQKKSNFSEVAFSTSQKLLLRLLRSCVLPLSSLPLPLFSLRFRSSFWSIPPQFVERNISKWWRFPIVGQLFMPRDQIVQDQHRKSADTGPGRSDLVT